MLLFSCSNKRTSVTIDNDMEFPAAVSSCISNTIGSELTVVNAHKSKEIKPRGSCVITGPVRDGDPGAYIGCIVIGDNLPEGMNYRISQADKAIHAADCN
jgi:hypothetical protein